MIPSILSVWSLRRQLVMRVGLRAKIRGAFDTRRFSFLDRYVACAGCTHLHMHQIGQKVLDGSP